MYNVHVTLWPCITQHLGVVRLSDTRSCLFLGLGCVTSSPWLSQVSSRLGRPESACSGRGRENLLGCCLASTDSRCWPPVSLRRGDS